ncbi:hypothetical protein [Spongiactinospora sp. TRM90649]|uniref:hypothetical protein n=1 Tax=Spongiactinospora sp. TRM90649 TaxID=3031114 RepID=UPI0023F9DA90|nr:hypothetical protein [Spongiactinospora sp. TRM90649]MDF5757090.1 hypothetical protein [Spongiactinospora sp. TRM90649]
MLVDWSTPAELEQPHNEGPARHRPHDLRRTFISSVLPVVDAVRRTHSGRRERQHRLQIIRLLDDLGTNCEGPAQPFDLPGQPRPSLFPQLNEPVTSDPARKVCPVL